MLPIRFHQPCSGSRGPGQTSRLSSSLATQTVLIVGRITLHQLKVRPEPPFLGAAGHIESGCGRDLVWATPSASSRRVFLVSRWVLLLAARTTLFSDYFTGLTARIPSHFL